MTMNRGPWRPLDGNMIAADEHYNQPRQSDQDFCDQCGREFGLRDDDGEPAKQHETLFMFCENCAEEWEDLK